MVAPASLPNPDIRRIQSGTPHRWGAKSGMVMKTTINIEIECTPAEARSFLGLPDVEPIQAAVMERLQERMLSEIDRFSPESLMTQWLSAFPQNAERMQEMFAKMFMSGFGQGRH